ncbi:MAG: helix-turn-helix transcriptional regulator [Gulosibacter sp.]|uniref:helix-turn-helix transcriptional regulator n=1 Tax=Gulosibacter sp. TaxID=2817531 RepID=UPI003F921F26
MAAKPNPALSASHQRQMRLLVRLLEAPHPITSEEIYQSVAEYRQRYDAEGRSDSLEKMFERDRALLADTGIEIETVADPTAPGDRARYRYQVKQDAAGGTSIELTAEEILLVNEATSAWLDPNLQSAARQTFVKLLGQGDSGAELQPSSPRTVVSTAPQFGALRDAVANRRRIGFEYLKQQSATPEQRDVDALHLFVHRGRWLLHGYDHHRSAPRNFLLTRILSDITDLGAHDRKLPRDRDVVASLEALAEENPVWVQVKVGSEAQVRLSARGEPVSTADNHDGWQELLVRDWDHGLLTDELAGLGTQVHVVKPAAVRDGVRERHETMLRVHSDAAAAHPNPAEEGE